MSADLFLAELVAWDIGGASTTTLRYGSRGHTTGPAETPANTHYDARISQPVNVARHCFAPRATIGRSVTAYGDLELVNADGGLDALCKDYAFDGRAITVRRGVVGAAYPGGFPALFVGTMEQAEAAGTTVRVRMRDPAFKLQQPLQGTLYAGNNALPAGLEGTADDLKGKPKPLCFGTVKNIAPPCVNTARLIYQVNDGTIASIERVYDAGIPLYGVDFVAVDHATPTVQYDIAYGDGKWVMGGSGGGIQLSTDGGLTWASQTSPFGANLVLAVAYGNGIWVAVTSAGEIATSTNATSWTLRTSPTGNALYHVHYGDGMWIAAGASGTLISAPDPTSTWTSRTSGFGTDIIYDGAFGAGRHVIVGDAGKVSTSTDGTTWTLGTGAFGTNAHRSLVYGGGQFVAVGAGGTVATSPDGLAWTARTSATTQHQFGVAYTFGRYVSVGASGSAQQSPDGVGWTRTTANFGGTTVNAAAGDDDQIVIACTDGPDVYRQGATGTTYSSLADLEDDGLAPTPGGFKYLSHANGSYIRLGSAPYGQVTCDVTQGAAAADRTAGSLFENILTKAGYTSADWVTGDVTTLDTADDSVLGLWNGVEPIDVDDALDLVANTVGAWWGPRASDGKFRIVQLLLPSGAAAAEFVASDLIGLPRLIPSADEGKGLPTWRTTLRYARNWTVQADGLALGVTDARRAFLAAEWRETADSDAAVKTAYLLAGDLVEETLFTVAADALAEAQRRQVIRETRRRMFEVTVQLNDDTDGLDLGDVVTLKHARFGLSAGVDFRIIGVEPDAAKGRVTFIVWGA